MFRITDFFYHLLGGEGGIKIKIKVRSAKSINFFYKTSKPNILSTSLIIVFSEQFVNIELIRFVGNCNRQMLTLF